MKCVYCQQEFSAMITLAEIIMLTPLMPHYLCASCKQSFSLNDGPEKCAGCDKESTEKYCDDCLYWQKEYPTMSFQHKALFKYNQEMHEWFEQFKFKGDINLGRTFSRELRVYFKKWHGWLIIPIPLSDKRLRNRGFNQVEILLNDSDISYSSLLLKKGHKKSQTSKSRVERLATKQSFCLSQDAKKKIQHQRILLVDDVYTTGRTIFHARECLAEAKPQEIVSFTLAR